MVPLRSADESKVTGRAGERGEPKAGGIRAFCHIARRVHEFDTLRETMSYRLLLEGRREDRDIEFAALGSGSLESLQRTHSRYFTGKDIGAGTRV